MMSCCFDIASRTVYDGRDVRCTKGCQGYLPACVHRTPMRPPRPHTSYTLSVKFRHSIQNPGLLPSFICHRNNALTRPDTSFLSKACPSSTVCRSSSRDIEKMYTLSLSGLMSDSICSCRASFSLPSISPRNTDSCTRYRPACLQHLAARVRARSFSMS